MERCLVLGIFAVVFFCWIEMSFICIALNCSLLFTIIVCTYCIEMKLEARVFFCRLIGQHDRRLNNWFEWANSFSFRPYFKNEPFDEETK